MSQLQKDALVSCAFESMARLLECTEDRQVVMIHIANKIHELGIPGTSNANGIFIDLNNISMDQLVSITDFLKICVNYQKQQTTYTPRSDTPTCPPPAKDVQKKDTLNSGKGGTRSVSTARGPRKEKPLMSDSAASLLKASLKSVRTKSTKSS